MHAESAELRLLLVHLEERFGALRLAWTKPFSVHYRDPVNAVLVKVYRVIDPAARQAREIEALRTALEFGLRVPQMLDHGQCDAVAWTAIEVVPGTPLAIRSPADVRVFVNAARSLMRLLHAHPASGGADHGWSGLAARSASDFLACQLSERLRTLPAWPPLYDRLRALDDLPVVHLHGDVKPDHVLLSDDGAPFLLDWEACARGPAVVDEADIAFRVVRDLVYAEAPSERVEGFLPESVTHTAALAWRLAVWLDRRHDAVGKDLTALVGEIARMSDDPVRAWSIVSAARNSGTSY